MSRTTHTDPRFLRATRRARNPIHVIPTTRDRRYALTKACVITLKPIGAPLHQANLAQGPPQVIVIPDETAVELEGYWKQADPLSCSGIILIRYRARKLVRRIRNQ